MDNRDDPFDRLPCPHRPLAFGEILVAGFRLTVETFWRGGVLALVVLLPLFMLFGEVARAFFIDAAQALGNAAQIGAHAAAEEHLANAMTTLAGSSILLNLMFLFLLLGFVLAQTAVTTDSWNRAFDERPNWLSWIGGTMGRPFWSGLVQLFLMIGLFVLMTVAALLLDFTVGGAACAGGSTAVWIAYVAGAAFLAVATLFRNHEIVADDRGPWHSLISSIALARGHFFRSLAILLVIILVYQTLSILSSLVFLPADDVQIPLTTDLQDTQAMARAWGILGRLMTPTFMAVSGATVWITLVFATNLITALYIDLRARRGDFDPEAEDSFPDDSELTFDEDETRD